MNQRLKETAKRLKSDVPAMYLSLKDRQTPFPAKLIAVIAVAYALSPIDLIPDFIPLLGALDDILILSVLIVLTIRMIPADVWARNKAASEDLWKNGTPKKWYCAVPVLLIWLLIICLIVYIVR